MSDSLESIRQTSLQRFARIPPAPPAKGQVHLPVPEEDDEVACAAFGYLRGIRERAVNIEFRRSREGDSVSFPYSWLGPSRQHPSSGVVLLFVGSELYLVTLRGRNLNRVTTDKISLYESGILRQRVTWVREVRREESEGLPREECVVERIEVRAVTPEEAARALGMSQEGS